MAESGSISIHVLSDSLGETGETVARAAAAQFAPGTYRIERLPKVVSAAHLRESVRAHCGSHCVFMYTFVNSDLVKEMEVLRAEGVNAVDLLGPAVRLLSEIANHAPMGEAGAIRRTDQEYFERIEAMEFTVKHDDGRNPEGLALADVVLIGVSRTSKTPLSMYLALKGYSVANIPLAKGVMPPSELFEVDPSRIFGLTSSVDTLLEIRSARMRELGTWVPGYAEREALENELEGARALMRRLGAYVIHTDNRAIEESAQEVMRQLEGSHLTAD
ncbi:MAG: kinase/pyrophosphorylase [Coriobacteriia bacterium]|nr:kinase/pyrophosphorylase [Coriobacteriia bacterium]